MNIIKNNASYLDCPTPSSPPKRLAMMGESRLLFDMGSMALSFAETVFQSNTNNASKSPKLPIILFPGFASDDRYLKPLAYYLQRYSYQTEGWGLGVNLAGINLPHTLEDLSDAWDVEPTADYQVDNYKGEGGVAYLCDQAIARVKQRSRELNSPVVLIGWSLGGYLARETARDLPKEVAQVITFGAPVVGGPKYTTAATVFKRKGFDLDWVEREVGKREQRLIQQPITAIFSKSDGVVDWHAAIDKFSSNVEHIEVNAPHLGMGFRREIWRLVKDRLDCREDFLR